MAVTLITQAEYARRRGVDPTTVRDAVRAGRITLIDGKIDEEVANIQWARNTRARVTAKPANGGQAIEAAPPVAPPQAQPGPTVAPLVETAYTDARAKRERAEAERAELEVGRLAGRLVELQTVEAGVFEVVRGLRDRVMASTAEAASAVLGLADVREIELALAEQLRAAFGNFEGDLLAAVTPKPPAGIKAAQ